jgi:hypothetical protein
MNHPGIPYNNFLSTRANKQAGDVRTTQISSSLASFPTKDNCLSLYYNLIKKKKPVEKKKAPLVKQKQIVLRSPSSQQRPADKHTASTKAEPENKDTDRKSRINEKFHASKVLFGEDKRISRFDENIHRTLESEPNYTPTNDHKSIFGKGSFKGNGDGEKQNLFLRSEPEISIADKVMDCNRLGGSQDKQLALNFDQIFAATKKKGNTSVSPKSSHLKSAASPYQSPGAEGGNQAQSTRSRSNLRDSRIDLLYDLENYTGPKIRVRPDILTNEFCIDHPDKKSKFYITNHIFAKDLGDGKMHRGFCSKCSVQIAMKGFTVEEVLCEEESERKIRIENFLKMLSEIKSNESARISRLKVLTAHTINTYDTDISNTVACFDELQVIIGRAAKLCKDKLIQSKESVLKQLAEVGTLLQTKLDTVKAMKTDIETNIEKIITKIDTQPFNQIIYNYENNLNVFEEDIKKKGQIRISRLKVVHQADKKFKDILTEIIKVEKGKEESVVDADVEELAKIMEVDSYSDNSRQSKNQNDTHENTYNLFLANPSLKLQRELYEASNKVTPKYSRGVSMGGKKVTESDSDQDGRVKTDPRKRGRGKDATTLSFDHQMVLARQKIGPILDRYIPGLRSEKDQWKLMRENRQFMSLGNGQQKYASSAQNETKVQSLRNIAEASKIAALSASECKREAQSVIAAESRPSHGGSKRQTQSYLHESSEKELAKDKKNGVQALADFNDGSSSMFSSQTDNDSTLKFINILDKINENQNKKNRFYSEIIKDIDLGEKLANPQLNNIDHQSQRFQIESLKTDQSEEKEDFSLPWRRPLVKSQGRGGPAQAQHIDHILELHQPSQNEIIFECSKEWTVNQTPDMREKEVMPPHLAQHFERLRGEAVEISSPPRLGDTPEEAQHLPPRVYRLSCQKDLFGGSGSGVSSFSPGQPMV